MNPKEVPEEVQEAALRLYEYMKTRSDWYPLFTILGDLVHGREMRPVIMRRPNHDIWEMHHQFRGPRTVQVSDIIKRLYEQWEY